MQTYVTLEPQGAFIKDGIVAFVEAETGVDLKAVYDDSGFGEALNTARTEVKGLVDSAGSPGFMSIADSLSVSAATTSAEQMVGFSCEKLCMLTKSVNQALQKDTGMAYQNYCEIPGTFVIGKFRCQGAGSTATAKAGSTAKHRHAMTCTVMKDAETTEDVLFAAAEGWLDVREGEVSTEMVAQYQGA